MDAIDLREKTALITGGGRGIGASIARAFLAAGSKVLVNHDPNDADSLVEAEEDWELYSADIGSVSAIRSMFSAIAKAHQRLDIVVNNAAVFPRTPVDDLDEEIWNRTTDVNLRGAFFCSQAASLQMRKVSSGAIINITSDAAYKGTTSNIAYAASKAGMVAMTRSLARAFAPLGIRVNAIAPGVTNTAQPNLSSADLDRLSAMIPMGRIGEPSDVASTALFLASNLSGFITGQTIHVNGGAIMVT